MLRIHLPRFPMLITERLVLRELRPGDAQQVFAMRSDPVVMRHVSRPLLASIHEASTFIERVTASVKAADSLQWAITMKGDDTFLGMIGFWRMEKEHHKGELGYMMARGAWGNGYMREAITAVVRYGFLDLGFHRVDALVRPENMASIRALEANGFHREGMHRQNVFANGIFHDTVHFGMLASGN